MDTILEKPIADNNYLLQKYPGKGGWTYASIPEIPQDRKAHFGWVKVKGSIDDYSFKNYRLMPMGNGSLFLPVKASVRKQIKKQAGDWVRVILFKDDDPLEIPEDVLICFKDEPLALKIFSSYTESEQKAFIDWINATKKESTRIERIAKTINTVLKGLKFRE